MTLEEALQRIVELETKQKEQAERYNALESIKTDLENSIKEKDQDIVTLKESNMKFFTMLTAQEASQASENPATQVVEEKITDWDDFMADF